MHRIRPNVRLAAVALVALLIGIAGGIEQGWVLASFSHLFDRSADESIIGVGRRIGMASLGIVSITQLLVLIFGARWALAKDETSPKSTWKYLAVISATAYPVAFTAWLAIEGTSSFIIGEEVFTWTSAHLIIAPYIWLAIAIPARMALGRGLKHLHLLILLIVWIGIFIALSVTVTESIIDSLMPMALMLVALAITSLRPVEQRSRGFIIAIWALPAIGAVFSVIVIIGLAMWPWLQTP